MTTASQFKAAAGQYPADWDKNIGSLLHKAQQGSPPVGALNPSGINPTEFKVLVEPKAVEEKIGSIILPDAKKEHDKYATTEGSIVAMSPLAFTYASTDEWSDGRPQVGNHVVFAKYAGLRVTGNDGKEYLLLNDKDVCAVRSK